MIEPGYESNEDGSSSMNAEGHLAALWLQLFGVSHEDEPVLVRAGGSSFDLVEIQLRMLKATGLSISLETLAIPATFSGLLEGLRATATQPPADARRIASASAARTPRPTENRVTLTGPASPPQEAQWILERANPRDPGNMIPFLVMLPKGVTWRELHSGILQLVESHPALRTRVGLESNEPTAKLLQIVRPAPRQIPLESRSVADLTQNSLQPIIDGLMESPPSLERGRVFRSVGINHQGQLSAVLFLFHHAAVDDSSLRILEADLLAILQGTETVLEVQTQLGWASAFSSVGVDRESWKWWSESLEGVPEGLKIKDGGGAAQSRRLRFRLDRSEKDRLELRAKKIGVSRAAVAVHTLGQAILSSGLAEGTKFSIGVPASLRDSHDLERTVGMFLATLPVAIEPDRGLLDTANALRRSWRHRRVPYQSILEASKSSRSTGRSPWLDVMIGVIEHDRGLPPTGSARELFSGGGAAPIFATVFFESDSVEVDLDLDTQLISESVGDQLCTRWAERLRWLEDAPLMKSVISGPECEDTARVQSLSHLVLDAAVRAPQAIAVETDAGDQCSYEELILDANRIATAIRSFDVSPGATVAILASPGIGYSKAMLGVTLARSGPMPVTPDLPSVRVKQMFDAVDPAIAILVGAVDPDVRRSLGDVPVIDLAELLGKTAPTRELPSNDAIETRLEDPCFVLFTSGSTGEPKAVRGSQASLVNLVAAECDRCDDEIVARTGQFAPLGFDVAFQEIFSTWAAGGTLCPMPLEIRADPECIDLFLRRKEITRTFLPPLVLRALAAQCSSGFPPALREVLCIGEQLRIDDAVRNAARPSHSIRIINQYGPAEAPQVTSLDLGTDPDRWPDRPTIGPPIRRVHIRIEDESGEPTPFGATGEIMIGGVSVGLGYANDPENPRFRNIDGVQWYQTGDLGRLLPGGDIEYLGRVDHQVKVAGHRVEPGEVEIAMAAMPEVSEAGVVTWTEEDVTRLAAFVVTTRDVDELRSALISKLPPWLVPTILTTVDEIPRNRNGKVDREQLRERAKAWSPEAPSASSPIDLESRSRLADLGIPPSILRDADTPLVEQGLDSLGAIRVQIQARTQLQVNITVAQILGSSPMEMLDILESANAGTERLRVETESPSRVIEGRDLALVGEESWKPLDPLVRDLLFEDAVSAAGSYHLAWRIIEPISTGTSDIERRLKSMREHWGTLRTCRHPDLGSRVMKIGELDPIVVEAYSGEPQKRELEHLLRHPLELRDGECFRCATWVDAGRRVTLLVFHHVAVDGRLAEQIIRREFVEDGAEGVFENSMGSLEITTSAEDWWVNQITLELTGDSLPKIPLLEADEAGIDFTTSFDVAGLLKESNRLSVAESGSPMAVCVLAWAMLLGRGSGKSRVVIGVPFASESGDGGLGVSLLPIVVPVGESIPISKALAATARMIIGGLEHRQAAMGPIIRRLDPEGTHIRPPLDGVITQDDLQRSYGEIDVHWQSIGRGPFQATLVVPSVDSPSSPVGVELESTVLQGESGESFLRRYFVILQQINEALSRGDSGLLLGAVEELGREDRIKIDAFESGDCFDPQFQSVTERFDDQVRSSKNAVAIIDSNRTFTYLELDRWSRNIASQLQKAGLNSGDFVALTGSRSGATIAAMLGVTRAGGCFVPIESDLPSERINAQLACARPRFAIGPDFGQFSSCNVEAWIDPTFVESEGNDPVEAPEIGLNSPFYSMFTSGTTGEPRGAVIPHRAILRLVEDAWFLPNGPGFKMFHAAPLAFDASTLEIWWTILNGGSVVCWEGVGADLQGMGDRIRRERVQGAWFTAALFHAAVDQYPLLFETLSIVLTGGDVVSADHVRRIQQRFPDLTVVNGYGPTENTVFTACESMGTGTLEDQNSLRIGRPVRGTRVRILDAQGHRAPIGRFGELVAEGSGVGLGYLDSVAAITMRGGFQSEGTKGASYRTGDRARWSSDGRIEFAGRLDHQVKISGRRIELAAIDDELRRISSLQDGAAGIIEMPGRPRRLGAVVIGTRKNRVDIDAIRTSLTRRLPAWEVPSEILGVERIPTTRNGKVDRDEVSRILMASLSGSSDHSSSRVEGASDEVVQIIIDVIEEITGQVVEDPSRTLSQLGVDSIELLRVAMRLEDRLARPVSLADVMDGSSIGMIASKLRSNIMQESKPLISLHSPDCVTSRALFCIPGVGGTVFSFQSILNGLPPLLPVYGLPYPGVGGVRKPLRRIEDLAENFVEIVRRTGMKKISIAGYSLGGFVGFELARLLQRENFEVRLLVVDAPVSLLPRRQWAGGRLASKAEVRVRLQNVLPESLHGIINSKRRSSMLSLRRVIAASFAAWRAYNPKPLDIDLTLIRSVESLKEEPSAGRSLGWEQLVRSLQIKMIPGGHLDAFRAGSMDLARAVEEMVNRP
jgi:amino acid adenylation domain-containing protein